MTASVQVLHEKAVQLTKSYLKAESDLIAILQKIDECKGYRELGFKSLYDYATQSLGLSESVSFNFITIARKSREVPRLQEMLQKQEITVSNARMIVPVLTLENQDKWLSSAAELSKRSLEKEIAKEFPEKQVQERTRYVSEKRIELKMGISENVHELLKRVQDLVSTQSGEAASFEETLRAALELYIEKKDPHKKAERSEKRSEKKLRKDSVERPAQISPVPGQVESKSGRSNLNQSNLNQSSLGQSSPRLIPAPLQHAIRLRDKSQCTYRTDQGARCQEKRWLDFHHIRPFSQGGPTSFENLTLLCRGHHQLIHH